MKELTRNRVDASVHGSYYSKGDSSKLATVSFGTVAIIIGMWSLICLASGFISVGGPVGLAVEWVKTFVC